MCHFISIPQHPPHTGPSWEGWAAVWVELPGTIWLLYDIPVLRILAFLHMYTCAWHCVFLHTSPVIGTCRWLCGSWRRYSFFQWSQKSVESFCCIMKSLVRLGLFFGCGLSVSFQPKSGTMSSRCLLFPVLLLLVLNCGWLRYS